MSGGGWRAAAARRDFPKPAASGLRKKARKSRRMIQRMDTGASLDVGFQRLEVRQGVSPGQTLKPSKEKADEIFGRDNSRIP